MNHLDPRRAIAAVILMCLPAWPQDTTAAPARTAAPAGRKWELYGAVFGYLIPEGRSYVSPVVTADRQSLHLEARYNYENLETGSFWLGRNFSFGDQLTLELTPMIGGVFGRTNGVAPGYTLSLGYRKLSLDSQGEYLFDTSERSSSFFYNWSELAYSPVEWFRAGMVVQRTKAYQTQFDVQRGVLAGFTYKKADFTTYVFNFGWTDPTVVFAAGYRF